MSPPAPPQSARVKATVSAALTVLALASLPLYYWAQRIERVDHELAHQIDHSVEEVTRQVQNKLRAIELVLRGVRGFVEGSETVTADEFHAFVHSLHIDTTAAGLMSVTYVPRVPARELRQFEASLPLLASANLGSERLTIQPPGPREVYGPILFIEPPQPLNVPVRGRDILTLPGARDAALRAEQTGEVSLSQRLSLADYGAGDSEAAFAMYLPITKETTQAKETTHASTTPAPATNPASLTGWAGARFLLKDILERGAQSVHAHLRLQVFDGPEPGPDRFMYGRLNDAPSAFSPLDGQAHTAIGHVDFGGQRWTLTVTPTDEYLSTHRDRSHHGLAALGVLLSLSAGAIVWLLMTARDRAQAAALEMTREIRAISSDLEGTLHAIPDLLYELDRSGRCLALRTRSPDGRVKPWQALEGQSVHDVLPAAAAEACMRALEQAERHGVSIGEQIELMVNGQTRWYELSMAKKPASDGAPTRYVMLSRDITDRRLSEERTHRLAFFDPLTQLPNRSHFMVAARERLQQSADKSALGAVVLIDLDNFKDVNDHWGHERGDRLLVMTARRIQEELSPHDTLSRLGGDEFMVLMTDLGSDATWATQRVEAFCTRLLASVVRPLVIDGREHVTTASCGVVMFGDAPKALDALLSEADSAMYYAKDSGRNTYRFFDGRLQAKIAGRVALEAELRQSIERRELYLHYQSQVDSQGRVVGAEALCRWHSSSRGPVSPAEFIPLAESSGFILEMGPWVLETACRSLADWQAHPALRDLSLAVNVSARQFHHPDFVRQVHEALDRTGAPAHRLKLELTESIFADDLEEIVAKMQTLKALGLRFSLDDFGTGYSSLSYLKKLPLDQLKIDQSFVRDVKVDSHDEAIIRTIIALGCSLGLSVIAEGVETADQRDFLLLNGCALYQGYLFGRPMAADEWVAQALASASQPEALTEWRTGPSPASGSVTAS